MSHQLTRHPDHSVEIDAQLDAPAVEEERHKIVRAFRGRARIPGFRQGKAPLSAVQTRYVDEIREELTEELVGVLWRTILEEEENFEPLTRPDFTDIDFLDDGGFSFKARLEVRPNFDLPSLDGVTLPEVSIEVAEAEIDGELDKICAEQASWEPADDDDAAVDGLLVECDITTTVEGADEEPKTDENAQIVVGGQGVPDEISEALQGAKAGDARTASTTIEPAEDPEGDEGSMKLNYDISVKALKKQVLPPIDDALAQGFGLEDLAELKVRIKDSLVQQKQSTRRDGWRRTALDHLQEKLDHETLPPALVTDAVNEDLQRYAYSLAMQGQNPDPNQMDWQALRVRFEPEARRRVLDTLVLEQLTREWEIPVPEEDVDDYVAAEAQRKGIPAAEHKANLQKENQLDRIRHAALMSTAVSEMLRRAGAEDDE